MEMPILKGETYYLAKFFPKTVHKNKKRNWAENGLGCPDPLKSANDLLLNNLVMYF